MKLIAVLRGAARGALGLLLGALPVAGCGESSDLPNGERRLMQAYVDLLVRRDSLSRLGPDTGVVRRHAVDSILASRGFSEEEFRSRFTSLPQDEDRFRRFMQASEQELLKRRSRATAADHR